MTISRVDSNQKEPVEERWALAEVLAEMPIVWRRLLDAHHADATGRCRGCRTQSGPAIPWPCTLYCAATAAGRIATRR